MDILPRKYSLSRIPIVKMPVWKEQLKAEPILDRLLANMATSLIFQRWREKTNRVGFAKIRQGFRTKYTEEQDYFNGYELYVVDELEVFGLTK